MKRINNLLEPASEMDNLRLAFWKASKGKRYAAQVMSFQDQLEDNLCLLRSQMMQGKVDVGHYHYFKVFDPKERMICASAFHEQVLHHALMNVCHPYFDRFQVFDSYASRPGKGLHAALDRASKFTKSGLWFLKLDIRKFFENVDHRVLKHQLEHLFKDYRLLHLFDQIIDSYCTSPGRGLPIGNLTSQYFANHYLSPLDHFIKEKLGVKFYVRYMDDLVFWDQDKDYLKRIFISVNEFVVHQLHATLKPPLFGKADQGLPFLGFLIFPYHIRLSQRSKTRFIKKIRKLEEAYHAGIWSENICHRKAQSLISYTKYAESAVLRKKVIYG